MNNYYQILGVTQNATLDQIKKAYRTKAKYLHPDRNKSESAHEQFILLNEAYEYLLNTTGHSTNRINRQKQQAQKQAAYQQQWQEKEREKARARAREYARMRYEAYIKSDIYKTTEAINVLADVLVTALVLMLVVGLPVLSYREHGPMSLIFSAIIILPTSPLWLSFLINIYKKINLKSLYLKSESTIQSKAINIVIFNFINIFLFFQITLNTLIQFRYVALLYLLGFITTYYTSKRIKRRYYRYLYKIVAAPLILNLLFLINYIFSFNPISETYWYKYDFQYSSSVYATIILNDNAYQKYVYLRTFFDTEEIKKHNQVTFVIKNGILGLIVVKETNIHSGNINP